MTQQSYEQSQLDRPRLEQYAQRVAKQTRATPYSPMTKEARRTVPITKQRSTGFLGMRTESYIEYQEQWVTELIGKPHWPLFETNHSISDTKRGKPYQYRERNIYALTTEAALVKWWWWEDNEEKGGVAYDMDVTMKPMTDEDILNLDHDFPYRHGRGYSGGSYEGNRTPGRLVRHAKGVGLSILLKQLLERPS